MRVLIVDHKEIYGGGQVALLNVLRAWAKQHAVLHPTIVCPPRAALVTYARAQQIPCVNFSLGEIQKTRSVIWNLAQRVVPTLRLLRVIRQRRAELVVANSAFSLLVSVFAAKLARVPLVWWEHNTTLPNDKFTRRMIQWANQIIVVSEPIREQFLELEPSAAKKITVIANGVDTEIFRAEPETRLALRRALEIENNWVVGTVSRLSPEKGIAYFVNAANQLANEMPRARFLIVGDGPEAERLRAYATTDALQFVGAQENIAEWLNAFDLFVMPSLEESFGLAVVEAMACGLPVIATNVGGLPYVVAENETGWLVPPQDVDALAEAIKNLSARPADCARMGEMARTRAEKCFSSERAAQAMLVVLAQTRIGNAV